MVFGGIEDVDVCLHIDWRLFTPRAYIRITIPILMIRTHSFLPSHRSTTGKYNR